MPLSSDCGGKDIEVSSILQSQFLAKFRNGHREIADSDIGSVNTCKGYFKVVLVHGCYTFDDKLTARKFRNLRVRDKQVTVGVELSDTKTLLHQFEAPCFHNGGIRLEEVGNG